jgi:hypothetical protein
MQCWKIQGNVDDRRVCGDRVPAVPYALVLCLGSSASPGRAWGKRIIRWRQAISESKRRYSALEVGQIANYVLCDSRRQLQPVAVT